MTDTERSGGDAMTDTEIKARLTDLPALAITIWAEARGDSREGNSSVEERIAVGCVVRNRVQHPTRWGSTYRDVCLARAQFSCWFAAGGDANYRRTMALARVFVEQAPFPVLSPLEHDLFQESVYLAEGIISGHLLDRVGGANHYYAPAGIVPKGRVPAWAVGRTPTATVGSQRFFTL